MIRNTLRSAALATTLLCSTLPFATMAQAQPAGLSVGANEIGGTVRSANGPEAGVWVIAETTDLPTKFAKIVVTNDEGKFLIPELPAAKYKVWVRGYGLVDSTRVDAEPGRTLELAAMPAPSEAAAAKYYPGMYWYSLLHIPAADQFPGTGEKGNGIPPFMKTQAAWLDTVKNSCQSCHALGSENIRSPKVALLGEFANSTEMWGRRLTSGQAATGMALAITRLGPEKGLSLYGEWTDRIAAGALPTDKPARPSGVERNMVASVWDWSVPTHYMHDAISTDKRHPEVNANGFIYGSPEESTDLVPVLDPKTNRAWTIAHPYQSGDAECGGRAAWDVAVLGRRGDLGWAYQQPQPDLRREGTALVRGAEPGGGGSGLVQEGVGFRGGEDRAAGEFGAAVVAV